MSRSLVDPSGDALQAKARRIRVAVFDVDGVMTDGTIYLTDSGEQMKGFNARDGLGIRLLQESGVRTAILTGRQSQCVELRARELRMAHVMQGVTDKAAGMRDLLLALDVAQDQVSYMGDDLADVPAMRRCGLAVTVPEASEIVRGQADLVTKAFGGRGAVREFCEFLMTAQGTWEARTAHFLGSVSS